MQPAIRVLVYESRKKLNANGREDSLHIRFQLLIRSNFKCSALKLDLVKLKKNISSFHCWLFRTAPQNGTFGADVCGKNDIFELHLKTEIRMGEYGDGWFSMFRPS